MVFDFKELVDVNKLLALIDSFYRITGIKGNLVDLKGNLIGISLDDGRPEGWQRICTDFHRKHPEALRRCIESDTELSIKMSTGENFASYHCLNGLVDLVVPVMIDGKHMANLFAGQFFFEKPNEQFFRHQALEFGFDEEKYLKALNEVPIVSKDYVKKAVDFLSKLAEMIVKMGVDRKNLLELNLEFEKKVAQRTREIQENQLFFEEILDGIKAAVLVFSLDDGEILDANHFAEELIKNNLETLLKCSKKPLDIDDQQGFGQEIYLTHETGEEHPYLLNVLFLTYKGKKCSALLLFDITEQKEMEQKAAVSQKLESIGQLAEGVAHEINTPIQYIGSNLNFLADSFSEVQDLIDKCSTNENGGEQESLSTIPQNSANIDVEFLKKEIPLAIQQSVDGIQQVSTIVNALKQFTHSGPEEFSSVNINETLRQVVTITQSIWKISAEVSFDLDENMSPINGQAGQLNQVFLNLVVNAAQTIDIIHKETGKKGLISILSSQSDRDISVTISDTGEGIPTEILGKIFDPFFTTKEVGAGTGQGLSIVYSLITQNHKGKIEVESKVGKGSSFKVTLPI